MSLQGYYLVVSILGWYWWVRGSGRKGKVPPDQESELRVSRLSLKPGIILAVVFFMLYAALFEVLRRFTDSPVPAFDSFITSLSIIATWMLARKIYEHWFLWIVVNASASVLFLTRGLYPTVILYIVYCAMSFAGLKEWRKSIVSEKI